MAAELNWRKASGSNQNSSCVEVAAVGKTVAIRDSKDRCGPMLRLPASAFQAFVTALREDRL